MEVQRIHEKHPELSYHQVMQRAINNLRREETEKVRAKKKTKRKTAKQSRKNNR